MICTKCQSEAMSSFPADLRFYMNSSRTISTPPLNPSPQVQVCLECGHAEFMVPTGWLASGWIRPIETPAYIAMPGAVIEEASRLY